MAVDLDKVRKHIKKRKEQKERRGKGKSNNVTLKDGKGRYFGFCPPHKNMGGLPWVLRMTHNRELPEEFKRKKPFSKRCLRDDPDEDISGCPACVRRNKYRDKRKKEKDKWDKLAGKWSPRRAPLTQIMDFTPLYGKDGRLRKGRKVKKCFLDFDADRDECDGCYLAKCCKKGVQRFYTPVDVWDDFSVNLDEEGNITDPNNLLPIRVLRTGTGRYNTDYSTKIAKDTLKLPKAVVKRMLEKMEDLTKVDPKPEGSRKEILKEYEDFFNFVDLEDDEDEEDELPDCFKDYEKKKAKKRKCSKCPVYDSCTSDEDEDDDDLDDLDDDEEEESPKKNLKKLRKKLKKGSKKGKHTRKKK
jgi:hypothetical protein